MVTLQQVLPEAFPPQDNLFQTAFWGTFKYSCGQRPLFFSAVYSDDTLSLIFPFMVLIRNQNNSCYAYAPKAPSVQISPEKRGTLLEELSLALQQYLPPQCICIRYDLAWRSLYGKSEIVRTESVQLAMNWGTKTHNLRKAPQNYMCPDTIIINISLTPEQILSQMRTTTRNCIRRAYRSTINFAVSGKDELPSWYTIYRQTALRKNFFHENAEYFDRLFSHEHIQENTVPEPSPERERSSHVKKETVIPMDAPAPLPQFYIMTAEKEGNLLSGIIIALCGHNAYYMYAGSSLGQRELMPNYGLQWEAIRFARSKGCTNYDLMGIPPNNDAAHPMAGLYIFKTGFGGESVRFAGTWDFPYDTEAYTYFTLEEQMK
jgi:lipid II:glycine glycyltransferase (peptidoglycan interpeptide bridge formation enzyme)